MEKLSLASTKFSVLAGVPTAPEIRIRRWPVYPVLPVPARGRGIRRSRGPRLLASSVTRETGDEASPRISLTVLGKLGMQHFSSISSSNSSEISAVSSVPQTPMPPPPSYFGSPLFWVGVGVGLSVIFSMVAARVKQYAMQQAFKTMMSQATPQNDQFSNAAFPAGSPFAFPSSPQSYPTAPQTPNFASQPVFVASLPSTKVEETHPPIEAKEQVEIKPNKYVFVDVSPAEVLKKDSEYAKELEEVDPQANSLTQKEVS